jgi:hypothetical protein
MGTLKNTVTAKQPRRYTSPASMMSVPAGPDIPTAP